VSWKRTQERRRAERRIERRRPAREVSRALAVDEIELPHRLLIIDDIDTNLNDNEEEE
jgi:hypothetical protein